MVKKIQEQLFSQKLKGARGNQIKAKVTFPGHILPEVGDPDSDRTSKLAWPREGRTQLEMLELI